MIENILVGIIVGVGLVLGGRSLYRTFAGKGNACSCASAGGCGSAVPSCPGRCAGGEGV